MTRISTSNPATPVNETHPSKPSLRTTKPIYMYDFNGNLVGKFKDPTEVAKKLMGNNQFATLSQNDSRKLSALKAELSMYAKTNAHPTSGITFVQGYVPSYEELNKDDITNNRKKANTRGNKVLQYDFAGNLIHIYNNAAEAAEKLGKSTAWISILCNADSILRYEK